MARRSGALQRAHILFVEPNCRRNKPSHTVTIQRAQAKTNRKLSEPAGISRRRVRSDALLGAKAYHRRNRSAADVGIVDPSGHPSPPLRRSLTDRRAGGPTLGPLRMYLVITHAAHHEVPMIVSMMPLPVRRQLGDQHFRIRRYQLRPKVGIRGFEFGEHRSKVRRSGIGATIPGNMGQQQCRVRRLR
jgi:hypothetical protein